MGYTFHIFRAPNVQRPEQLSRQTMLSMGAPDVIKAAIAHAFPDVAWDGARGRADGGAIELVVDDEPEVDSVYVRASFRVESREKIRALCANNGWVAFDGQANELLY